MTTGTGSDLRATTEADTRPLAYGQTSEVGDMRTFIIKFSDGTATRLQAVNVDQAKNRGYRFFPSNGTIVDVHSV